MVNEQVVVNTMLVAFDLGGTFVFALSGAAAGVKHRLDLFGVLVLSFAAGNSGGIARDVMIGATPPAALSDWRYIAVSMLAGLITFYWYRIDERILDKTMPYWNFRFLTDEDLASIIVFLRGIPAVHHALPPRNPMRLRLHAAENIWFTSAPAPGVTPPAIRRAGRWRGCCLPAEEYSCAPGVRWRARTSRAMPPGLATTTRRNSSAPFAPAV